MRKPWDKIKDWFGYIGDQVGDTVFNCLSTQLDTKGWTECNYYVGCGSMQ